MTSFDLTSIDLPAARERLRATRGASYWRCLEEIAQTPGFQAMLEREFPEAAACWPDPLSRRRFLALMGASFGLAGLGACARQPSETIVPYVHQPEEVVPGTPLLFATALSLQGYATGVLVESHAGRPTKIEGNGLHPASLGRTDALTQAAILDLYDPDRSQVVKHAGQIATWEALVNELTSALDRHRARQGRGLRLLTDTVTSPSLTHEIAGLLTDLPEARWHQHEPVPRDNVRAGARLAFMDDEDLEPCYRFERADVVVSLDADFLYAGPSHLRDARAFMARRRLADGARSMNRLYVVEPTPSLTGAMADHRLALAATQVELVGRSLARRLGIPIPGPEPSGIPASWLDAVAQDLEDHRGAGIALAGDQQPPVVHAICHAINNRLDNAGETVVWVSPAGASGAEPEISALAGSLHELVDDMRDGRVETLVILGGNPVYTAPADLGFADELGRVGLRIHLGPYDDETAALCHWHVPAAHELESWGDVRAFDGTVTIRQPLIDPLYGGRTPHQLVATLRGQSDRSAHDLLRDSWRRQRAGQDFEAFWRRSLHDGLVAGTAWPVRTPRVRDTVFDTLPEAVSRGPGVEVVFRPDPCVFDGRFANNGWLQELPKPLTQLTWDNAVLVSPALADRRSLLNEQVVELSFRNRTVSGPVWIQPGQADASVTLHLGYGRERIGRVGQGAGFNAYRLRVSDALWSGDGLEIHPTNRHHPLATTQHHHAMEDRHLVREAALATYLQQPDFAHAEESEPSRDLTLYPPRPQDGHAWGMTVDLNTCTGCNACVVACQAENNIPIVGKEQVLSGREMHWIRVDRYYRGSLDAPSVMHQPVMCMHCEQAPCEPVCPVGATVHSPEGLNEMVYNRCIGTRYCSNNCPYKVRRFNFLAYADYDTPVLKLLRNPDVTVRSRGVMEKCTYCVQRISHARIQAGQDDRTIRDGEIVTACEAACPTEAIVFGDVNDPSSRVSRLKADPRNYGMLTGLNTRPRTTYLARVRNPNPRIVDP